MLEDRSHPNHPGASRDQQWRERDQEHRRLDKERYLSKFEGLFMDVESAIAGLEVLGEFDSAAKEAANALSDALSDARSIVEAGA